MPLEIAPDAALALALLSQGSASVQVVDSPDPQGDAAALHRIAPRVLDRGRWQVDGNDPAGAFIWIDMTGMPDGERVAVLDRLADGLASRGRRGTVVVHDGVPPRLRQAFCSRTGLPAGWPDDVPLPPGAALTSARGAADELEIELDCPDAAAFYRGALLALGFQPAGANRFTRGGLTVAVSGRRVSVRPR